MAQLLLGKFCINILIRLTEVLMSFSAAIAGSLASMNSAAGATEIIGGNIANSETEGFKTFQTLYNSVVNASGTSSNGVTNVTRLLANKQGNVQRTDIATDIAIQGKGMFVVSDDADSDAVYFSKAGSFRRDKDGNFALPSGHLLKAWALDANGNLPAARSIVSSLDVVNVQSLVSQASATTTVDTSLNLSSAENVAGNSSVSLQLSSDNNQHLNARDIIDEGSNGLTQGEGLRLKLGQVGKDEDKIVNLVYDGFIKTATIDTAAGVSTLNSNVTLSNNTISIAIGNSQETATFTTTMTNQQILDELRQTMEDLSGNDSMSFRSLESSANNEYMLVSASDIDKAVTFTGNMDLMSALGLSNIEAADYRSEDIETYRFSSLQNLTDILEDNIGGVSAQTDNNAGTGRITLFSENALYIDNYTPEGRDSDFLTEFGIGTAQYAQSLYNPYDSDFNMAGGGIDADFTRDFTIYDSMGNEYVCLMSFLRLDTSEWAVEVHVNDSTSLSTGSRADGLLQAGTLTFDGVGTLSAKDGFSVRQSTNGVNDANASFGATNGQTFLMTVGTTNPRTYNYSEGTTSASTNTSTSTNITAGDTFDVTIDDGSTTDTTRFTIPSGTANDLSTLNALRDEINETVGKYAIRAEVINDGTNVNLEIRAADITYGVSIAEVSGTPAADIGFTAGTLDAVDTERFRTLYDLSDRINETGNQQGAVESRVTYNDDTGGYNLTLHASSTDDDITFGGTSAAINSPLGNGNNDTIFNALGLVNTATIDAISGLNDTVTVEWSGSIGAQDNQIDFDWGTVGDPDGVGQVAQGYVVNRIDQNGVSTGELTTIQIDDDGYVIANFSNSKTRSIYKLAIADFTNFNGLVAQDGNVYAASRDSGPLNLKEAKTEGVGGIVSGSLEGSNVDVGEELANLIQIQRRYQASAKVVNVVDKLLEELIHRAFN